MGVPSLHQERGQMSLATRMRHLLVPAVWLLSGVSNKEAEVIEGMATREESIVYGSRPGAVHVMGWKRGSLPKVVNKSPKGKAPMPILSSRFGKSDALVGERFIRKLIVR